MKLGKRNLNLLIIVLYSTTLLFANNNISSLIGLDGIEKYLVLVPSGILTLSLFVDWIKYKKLNKLNTALLLTCIFVFLISIVFGIYISTFNLKALIHAGLVLVLGALLFTTKFTEEDFIKIKKHIYIVFSVVVLFGIFQYIFDFGLTNKFDSLKYIGIKGRVISTYHIATVLDKYLIMIMIPITYDLLLKKDYKLSILYLLGSIAMAITFTRAGIVAYLFLSFIFLIISVLRKKYLNILTILISFVIILLIPGYKYALQSTKDYIYQKLSIPSSLQLRIVSKVDMEEHNIKDIAEDESVLYRDFYEYVGVSLIKEYPLTGVGLGNYPYLYHNQNVNDYLENKIEIKEPYMYPHNGFIQMTAEIGIIGIVSLLTFLASFMITKNINYMSYYPSILLYIIYLLGTYTEGLFTTKQYIYVFITIYTIYSSYLLNKKNI